MAQTASQGGGRPEASQGEAGQAQGKEKKRDGGTEVSGLETTSGLIEGRLLFSVTQVMRADEEKRMAERKKQEEERRQREVEEKKQRDIEEKRRRLEEAEKKRQAMMAALKVKRNLPRDLPASFSQAAAKRC